MSTNDERTYFGGFGGPRYFGGFLQDENHDEHTCPLCQLKDQINQTLDQWTNQQPAHEDQE